MRFIIKSQNDTAVTLARRIGYKPIGVDADNEYSVIRPLTNRDYPRFHIYMKRNEEEFEINLHLDQKMASYEGSHSHSGEYEGDLVEKEAERIKKETD